MPMIHLECKKSGIFHLKQENKGDIYTFWRVLYIKTGALTKAQKVFLHESVGYTAAFQDPSLAF